MSIAEAVGELIHKIEAMESSNKKLDEALSVVLCALEDLVSAVNRCARKEIEGISIPNECEPELSQARAAIKKAGDA